MEQLIDELRPIRNKGPRNARVVVVGDSPSEWDVKAGEPFAGQVGRELDKMLADAGIDPATVHYTHVVLVPPLKHDIENWVQTSNKKKTRGKKITPDHWIEYRGWLVEPYVERDAKHLIEELKAIKPNIVLALGNIPFWALCKEGAHGKVMTWRGSTLLSDAIPGLKVIPALHPSAVLKQWQHRRITVQDYRRAAAASLTPDLPDTGWEFTLAPTYDQTASFLNGLLYRLEEGPVPMTCDVEVSQQKVLCVGIGVSAKQAICIPFLYKYDFYFSREKHLIIVALMQRVLGHKNARVINQNIAYDTQFLVNDFLCYPNIYWDTMIAQNILFPGTTMNLAYQASMYCSQYRYWKDDGKFWKVKEIKNWEQLWFYNCEDAARTFEVYERQAASIQKRKLVKQHAFLQDRIFPLIRKAMFRGVRVDHARKSRMLLELLKVVEDAQARVNYLATRQLDIASPVQLKDFFYSELGLKPVLNEEGRPTCDGEALVQLAEQEPLVRELVRWINLVRSYSTAITVCKAKTDPDGRWRCSYSLGLVETYRLSSSKNPYDRGLNLMNISSGKDIKGNEDDD